MARPVFEDQALSGNLTASIVTGLERISDKIQTLLKQQALEHELSPLQLRILLFIHFYEQKTTLSLLAGSFDLSKATLSVALQTMEHKKLIKRSKAAEDQRISFISLTEWGSQIAHVAGFYPEPLRKIIAPIAHKEKEILLKNINGILRRLSELDI